MAEKFARFISIVFHPLLIPTYSFSLLSLIYPHGLEPIPVGSHSVFLILIFIVTFALPLLNISILKAFGFVKSYQMPTRSERVVPFVLVSVIYIAITYLFFWKSRIGLDDNFMKFMLIIDMLVIVATILTFFAKISIHALTIWGVVGIIIPLYKITAVDLLFYPTLVIVVIAGIIMSSRLILQVHSLREVLAGSMVGLATGIAGMMIFFGL